MHIREDDILIDEVLQKNMQLENVTHDISSFFGKLVYSTTRDTLLGNMCSFLSYTIQEAIVIMGTKACHVRISNYYQNRPGYLFSKLRRLPEAMFSI